MGIRASRSGDAAVSRASWSRARGLLGAVRSGHVDARVLAVADSRALVRSLFLSSGTRLGVFAFLRKPRSFAEIERELRVTRADRLAAWLAVGVEVRELRRADDTYALRGRRARAIADGDTMLSAHYRSVLDYQAGPYDDIEQLLHGPPADGRSDLERHASIIADVSVAAAPFVVPFLREVVDEIRPRRVLDVGCGTGVYTRALLDADSTLRVDGIDLAPTVIDQASARLAAAGHASRASLHAGDVREFVTRTDGRPYELITLLNNVYYFPPAERAALYEQLAGTLADDGALVIVTMAWPGSVASAHLHMMLVSQAGSAALPNRETIEADLRHAGFQVGPARTLVPLEPFVAIVARRPAT